MAAGQPRRGPGDSRAVTVSGYFALFALGVVLGLIGTFQYSRGPGPVVAICFDLAILVTCLLGARGMRSAAGGVLPAVGWLIVTIVLSSVTGDGSILVTATTPGEWFLFGGTAAAAAGAVIAYVRWSRASWSRRAG